MAHPEHSEKPETLDTISRKSLKKEAMVHLETLKLATELSRLSVLKNLLI